MEDIKDIIEILELAKEEIENNDENITATLDLQDLKSLKNLYELYKKEIKKNKSIAYKLEEREARLQEEINEVCKLKTDLYGNSISKDKIRDKIKELKQVMEKDEVDDFGNHSIGWGALDYIVEQLQELLEEGN